MKKQILDSPFLEPSKYAFEEILKKDETILWRGKPSTEKLFSLLDFSIIGLLIFALYPLQFASNDVIGFALGGILLFSLYFGKKVYRIITIRNIRYAITPTRILWSSKKIPPRDSYYIDFKNIKWAEIEDNAIFIRPKNYDLVAFQTYSFKDLSLRKKPTMENIKNISEVYDLIEKHINENNLK